MAQQLCFADQQQSLQRDLLAKALECTANAIFITDETGQIIWINEAFSLLSGYSHEEAIGHTPAILKSGKQSEAFYEDLWQTVLAGKVWRGTLVDQRKDRTLYTVDEIITPLMDQHGNITHFVVIQNDTTLRKQEDERNQYLAYHDGLTGLPNRALFMVKLEQAISHAKRAQHMFALLFLDLDHFKPINDTFGHGIGDRLLVAAAERLRTVIRKEDTIARLGGDEFVILLANLLDTEIAQTLARKLLDTLSQPFVFKEQKLRTQASIGISIYPSDSEEQESLLDHADKAMYAAKKQGGNGYQLYSHFLAAPCSTNKPMVADANHHHEEPR